MKTKGWGGGFRKENNSPCVYWVEEANCKSQLWGGHKKSVKQDIRQINQGNFKGTDSERSKRRKCRSGAEDRNGGKKEKIFYRLTKEDFKKQGGVFFVNKTARRKLPSQREGRF